MGTLWADTEKKQTLAVFENGTIYEGENTFGSLLGKYDTSGVYVFQGGKKKVAEYRGNAVYSLEGGTAYCCSDDERIYEGSRTDNNWIAMYEGDAVGACAAAVLHFHLYAEEEETSVATAKPTRPAGLFGYAGDAVIGLIFLIVTWYFYFTKAGRHLLFGDFSGYLYLAICLAAAVLGGRRIYQDPQNANASVTQLLHLALKSYKHAIIAILVFGAILSIIKGVFSLLGLLGIFLSTALMIIGIAVPFLVIEIIVLKYLFKRDSKA